MAYYVLVINSTNDSVDNLRQKTYRGSANDDINQLIQYLQGFAMGNVTGSVQITIRDTDPSVATHGTNSVQKTHSK